MFVISLHFINVDFSVSGEKENRFYYEEISKCPWEDPFKS
jgi:hypothetical protein